MPFALSPSVTVKEIDFTTRIPNVATSIVGTVGAFSWGPCFERKLTTSETDMVNYFGTPTDTNFADWFVAAEFLRYGNNLLVVRSVDAVTAKNAGLIIRKDNYSGTTIVPTSTYIPNTSSVPTISFDASDKLKFYAKYPGIWANSSIKIALCSASDFDTADIDSGVSFDSNFSQIPVVGAYDYLDQLAIAVSVLNPINQTWSIVEKFIVDLDPTVKNGYNRSNYIETIINNQSQYIYCFNNTSVADLPDSFENTLLEGGVAGTPATGDIEFGYDLFASPEEVDINFIIDGANNNETIGAYISAICDTRMDCVGIVTVPQETVVNALDLATAVEDCVTYRKTTLNLNTSYCAMYANWKQMYDKYNEKNRWIPVSGDIAGTFVYTDNVAYPWYANAGMIRGQLKNVLRLAINPNRAHRDSLYKNNINPIVGFPGEGNVLFGQKTLLTRPSAFDRLNVRRLFIILEKSIATAAKAMMFEFNNEFNRNAFKLMVSPYLRYIKSLNGIEDGFVVCDETNNPGIVRQNNGFVGDIYIKPMYVAEFIQLNFIAVGPDVSFSEQLIS